MTETLALALFGAAGVLYLAYLVVLVRLDGWDDPRRRPPASHPRDPFDRRA